MVLRSNGLMIGYRDGNRRMFVFPPSVITATVLVYGGKGMGKTNLLSVTLEEMSKRDLKWCSIDPIGVHYGLRHSADGKGAGVKCLILGGVHGDIAIYPDSGEIVADLVADNDVNVIIDCSRNKQGQMWTVGERTRFITAFVLRLFQRQGSLVNGRRREPLFVALDEAARYIPQMVPAGPHGADLAKSLGAWEQLVEEGRNVGIGVGLFTQRSARINKSVAELADVMIAFRTTGPNSINAIIDWLGEHVPKTDQRTMIEQVRKLPVGTALVVSPGWLEYEGVVQMRPRETFDSSATPKPGQRAKRIHGRGATVDLAAYEQRMAEAIERAEAEDPKKLRARIAELEKMLKTQIKVEVPVPEPVVQIEYRTPDWMIDRLHEVIKELGPIENAAHVAYGILTKAVVDSGEQKLKDTLARPRAKKQAVASPRVAKQAVAKRDIPPFNAPPSTVNLRSGARRMVETLVRMHPLRLTKAQWGTLSKMKTSSGTWSTYLSEIRGLGYIDQNSAGFTATEKAMNDFGRGVQRMSLEEIREHYRSILRAGARAMFDALLEAYPRSLSRQELGEAAQMSTASGTFSTYLSDLTRNGLAERVDGGVIATEAMFMEVPA